MESSTRIKLMDKKQRENFNRMVDRLTKGKDTKCNSCGRVMVPMEFVLRKGECVLCTTLREMKIDDWKKVKMSSLW